MTQPLVMVGDVLRFKENKIINFLVDQDPTILNTIAMTDFSVEDREQFYQLIGYSLSGFGDLSFVRDVTYDTALKMFKTGTTELQAQNLVLSAKLEAIREIL